MDHIKSNTHQEKSEHVSRLHAFHSKLGDVQKIIRNKFKKACSNRLACERDANLTMKPLAATSKQVMHQHQQHSPAKNDSNRAFKYRLVDPNTLCNRLRVLIASTSASDVKQSEEIKAIIKKLHDLEIIV